MLRILKKIQSVKKKNQKSLRVVDNINMKLQLGQKLLSYSFNKNKELVFKEHTISELGRKYFEVNNERGRYLVDSLCYHDMYSRLSPLRLYISETAIYEFEEQCFLKEKMKKVFSEYNSTGLSLNILRKINEILEKSV